MSETIASTNTFNLPVDDLIIQALEGLGGEHISHEEARRARIALNLTLIDIQNYGMTPIASLEKVSVTIASGSSQAYSMGSDLFDVLDLVVRVSSSGSYIDYPMQRISMGDWLDIPTKESTTARPTQFFVQKTRTDMQLTVWPNPDAGNYSIFGWALKKIADITAGYQLLDVPASYLPAVVLGLRYHLALLRRDPTKSTAWSLQEYQGMKQDFLEAIDRAMSNDRERTDFNVSPASRPQLR